MELRDKLSAKEIVALEEEAEAKFEKVKQFKAEVETYKQEHPNG